MTKSEWPEYIEILTKEVVPALGCTEPIAVALAAARAAEALGTSPDHLTVLVSGNLLKNGMGVGVPKTGMTGLAIAATVGALGGKSELKLEVLRDLTDAHVTKAKRMLDQNRIHLALADNQELIYVDVTAKTGSQSARCVIAREHHAIVRVEKNGDVIFNHPWPDDDNPREKWPLTVEKIYNFAVSASLDDIRFILEAVRLNSAVASEGLSGDWGLNVGRSMDEDIEKGLRSDDIGGFAVKLAAAASDARMDGSMQPVMSNSGSGNQGITATIPVMAFARRLNADEEALIRALIMSHLTTIHLKHYLGRLSALCGATLAATGAGCGITMLLGGKMAEIERTVKNMVGTLSGMICDGAKTSCALKVATSVEAAIQAAFLAMKGISVSGREGIVDDDLETSIKNLGHLGSNGMGGTDKVILDIMVSKD